jgi:hypothetical protein
MLAFANSLMLPLVATYRCQTVSSLRLAVAVDAAFVLHRVKCEEEGNYLEAGRAHRQV